MIKITALGLFTDPHLRYMHHYLHNHGMDYLRDLLRLCVNLEERLQYVLQDEQRWDQMLVKATEIIQRFFVLCQQWPEAEGCCTNGHVVC